MTLAVMAAWSSAAAAEAWLPQTYAAALVGTTLAHRPEAGPIAGWQRDVTGSIGVGRTLSQRFAVELDVGLTEIDGSYGGVSLVPGFVWAFDPQLYAAARFIVTVDPGASFAVAPGIGAIHVFAGGLAPNVELNLISNLGEGRPDLALSLTGGVLYLF